MKKSIILLFVSLLIFSCKKDTSKESDKEPTLIRGEFILIDGAGVIKGADFIYGVIIDDMAKQLDAKVKPLQREEYDMVPVVINGIIQKNADEGWPEVVKITEIIGVTEPTSELPTKIKTSEGSTEQNEASEGHDHQGHGHEGHSH
ncbi:hypothetical protein GCM10022393_05690 [Aquimarina addita]|uniref:Uncharacterized protein n=1 Tax=Aquimarina addita TaxID=870485 RepID=A0ABP7XCN9_9FLAO